MAWSPFQTELRLSDIATIGGFKMQGAEANAYTGFNFGWADVNNDGLSDLLVCADGYSGGGLFAGGAFVVYGKRGDAPPFLDLGQMVQTDGFVVQGEFAYDLASRMLSSAGDVNGDGIEDLLIGAFKNDEGSYDSGAAYIIYGRSTLFEPVLDLYDLPVDVGIKIVGEASEDYASFWVAPAGDVNGDGRADLIMGAPQNDAGGSNAGAAYVIFGRDTDFSGKIDLATLDPSVGFKITGAAAADVAGLAVGAAGDFDGDGFADLLIGAPQNGTAGKGLGYLLYGRPDIAAIDLAQPDATRHFAIVGEAAGDMAGYNIAGAGDVNGDGLGDIVIGAPGNAGNGGDAGAAYVIFGTGSEIGRTFDLATLSGTNGFKISGVAANDQTGICVATAGDVNGDGFDDVLVGVPASDLKGVNSGASYLLFGRMGGFSPVIDLANLSPRDGIRILGEGAGDGTGRALSVAGDMNGDGYDDIAIGSPWNGGAGFEAGAAYVIYGRPDNRAPTALESRVVGMEGVPYAFDGADFGFTDPDGSALKEVRIATLATRGTLVLRDEAGTSVRAVTAGEIVSTDALAAGRLLFIGEDGASGPAYASFAFQVRDDDGTVANGADLSRNVATLTISIDADPTNGDNEIYGTSGNDVLLTSKPSAQLYGLGGDDLYTVSNGNQVAIEAVGEGFDTVRTSASYALSAPSEVEALEAVDPSSLASLTLTGNRFDNIIRGNAGTNVLQGAGGNDVLDGRGGNDAYVVLAGDRVVEAAGGGYDTVYALENYVLTAGAHVEVLLAYDRDSFSLLNLVGNEVNNLILGNRGDNVLVGGGGRDTMHGYNGNDTFYVDSADDLPIETYGEGYDTIVTSVSFTITQGMEFEVLQTIDPAATSAIELTGNKIANLIVGNAGENVIDGLGGGDTMQGLGGNDIYVVRNPNDRVVEAAGAGSDTVRVLVDHDLLGNAEVERLEAYDPLSTITLRLTGNRFDQTIIGNAGANVIHGGTGFDVLSGLGGSDAYVVADSRARVIEAANGGYDTVYTLTDYTLNVGSEVEVLTVYDRSTFGAINLTGNEFANLIYGNAGDNILTGGSGADTLYGLAGNDTFFLDDTGDSIMELAGGGFDTAYTSVNYTLAADASVEMLAALDRSSTGGVRLSGNQLDNVILGTAGNDSIYSGGGRDALRGFEGDDSYLVEDSRAVVIEEVDQGSDTVYSVVSYELASGSRVETLTVYDRETTNGIDLSGNEFANLIYGNDGENRLDGGLGSDVLYGLGGDDSFVFSTALGLDNVDTIVDFVSGSDRILLYHDLFDSVDLGTLSASNFVTGSQAYDADDRFIYNDVSGALSYDADGSGMEAAIQFAYLAPYSSLTFTDLIIV